MTNKKYKNIFEMRFLKNYYLINIMKQKVKNYELLNYETLKNNYSQILTNLQLKFNLIPKFSIYKNIHYHKKEKNTKFKTKKINLPPDIINLITKNVNIQQENRLNYII